VNGLFHFDPHLAPHHPWSVDDELNKAALPTAAASLGTERKLWRTSHPQIV